MRVAILDDEKTQLQLVEYALVGGDNDWGEEVECICFNSGQSLMDELTSGKQYDFLIMDRQLPDMSGDVILQWVRQYGASHTAVIMISNLRTEDEVVNSITIGADDYLTKPFRPKELVARVKRLRQRLGALNQPVSTKAIAPDDSIETLNFESIQDIELNGYRFNRATLVVTWDNGRVRLTEREFSLALYLFCNTGISLSRDQIFQRVWKRSDVTNGRVLTTLMYRVRMLLNLTQGGNVVLHPVYGYRLDKRDL